MYIYIYSLLIIVSFILLLVLFIPFHLFFDIKCHEGVLFGKITVRWLFLSHSSSKNHAFFSDESVSDQDVSPVEDPGETGEGYDHKSEDEIKHNTIPSDTSSAGEKIYEMRKWTLLSG